METVIEHVKGYVEAAGIRYRVNLEIDEGSHACQASVTRPDGKTHEVSLPWIGFTGMTMREAALAVNGGA